MVEIVPRNDGFLGRLSSLRQKNRLNAPHLFEADRAQNAWSLWLKLLKCSTREPRQRDNGKTYSPDFPSLKSTFDGTDDLTV